jgi:hypothetical protein
MDGKEPEADVGGAGGLGLAAAGAKQRAAAGVKKSSLGIGLAAAGAKQRATAGVKKSSLGPGLAIAGAEKHKEKDFESIWLTMNKSALKTPPGEEVEDNYLCWRKHRKGGPAPDPAREMKVLSRLGLLVDQRKPDPLIDAARLSAIGEALAARHSRRLLKYKTVNYAVPRGNLKMALYVIQMAMLDCGYVLAPEDDVLEHE